jgi:hypothetical protein
MGLSMSVLSRSQSPVQIPETHQKLRFDGIPNEELWKSCPPFEFVTHVPVTGNTPTEKTDARLVYDDEYLYVGVRLYYQDPGIIQAIGKKRDFEGSNCDFFGITLDTYNDKENAMIFFTNPNGLRWDASIKNDAAIIEDEIPMNVNWNTYWDVEAVIDSLGWACEIRIPVSSLRFEDGDSGVTMGISMFRWIPILNEGYIYPDIPYNWGDFSKLKPSQLQEIRFADLKPKKPLYITPYLLTGIEKQVRMNEEETGYESSVPAILEPGMDVKYGISPNTTLDLTLNTDFAQIESDELKFNLSRFSLYFEEKRPFFLERASIFDFNLGGPNNLFYSRRIGLHEGEPVRIFGGARLISRKGKWDMGFLDMQTEAFQELPSENFGVFRARRNVFNDHSYAGGILTTRLGTDGSYNIAYGLDGVFNITGNDYLTLKWSQTFEDDKESNIASLDPSRFYILWSKRKDVGFSYNLTGTYSGKDFNPDIGFEAFQNYWTLKPSLRYGINSPEESPFHKHILSTTHYNISSVLDNSLISWSSNFQYRFSMKKGFSGLFSLEYNYENLDESFELTESVTIPEGKYEFLNFLSYINTSPGRKFWILAELIAGQYYDGYRISPGISPHWSLTPSLELAANYKYDYVHFSSRDDYVRNHITGIKVLYMASTRLTVSSYLQYHSGIEKVISNFRFRFNPREGTDLFLVFNEGRNTLPERYDPVKPEAYYRGIMLKFRYTFIGSIGKW